GGGIVTTAATAGHVLDARFDLFARQSGAEHERAVPAWHDRSYNLAAGEEFAAPEVALGNWEEYAVVQTFFQVGQHLQRFGLVQTPFAVGGPVGARKLRDHWVIEKQLIDDDRHHKFGGRLERLACCEEIIPGSDRRLHARSLQ